MLNHVVCASKALGGDISDGITGQLVSKSEAGPSTGQQQAPGESMNGYVVITLCLLSVENCVV